MGQSNNAYVDLLAERDRLAAANATLEAMLADEVAENVRLRSREVGDEVGNLLQEVTDLKNELARVKAESLRVVVDRTPMPAAGPWRYDVENAPFDTQLLCWQETPDGCDWHCIGMKRAEQDEWECGLPGCVHDAPIAFATINRPETPHALGE